MDKYKPSRELLADTAYAAGMRAWADNIMAAKTSDIIEDSDFTRVSLIALELRSDELDEALERLEINATMVQRALKGFDCGTVDPNDYKRRMRLALEAALKG